MEDWKKTDEAVSVQLSAVVLLQVISSQFCCRSRCCSSNCTSSEKSKLGVVWRKLLCTNTLRSFSISSCGS